MPAVLPHMQWKNIPLCRKKTFDDILQNDTLTNLTESYHKELLEAIEKKGRKQIMNEITMLTNADPLIRMALDEGYHERRHFDQCRNAGSKTG